MRKTLWIVTLMAALFAGSIVDDAARAGGGVSTGVVIVNAASYDSVVASGSIAALFGSNLTVETRSATALPLPTMLGGIAVKIGGKSAPLFFVSPSQINLQVPNGVGPGSVSIEVLGVGSSSPLSTGTVLIAESAPGVFTIDSSGRGQASAVNSDYTWNGNFGLLPGARPEMAGSYVAIFATGIGPTSPIVSDGEAAPVEGLAYGTGTTTVTVAGQQVPVLFSGLAPGFAGLWQINIQLPADLPTNPATSLRITRNLSSTETTLAVAGRRDYSVVSGNVIDGLSGGVVTRASVALTSAGQPNPVSRVTATDAQGGFTFPVVGPGSYTIDVSATGFESGSAVVTAVAGESATASLTLAKQRPNIIVVIADDLGYADLGIQGSTEILSPAIDSIARNGIRFTNGYVSAPVCAPTRAGFLTGRYQQRFGYELLPAPNDTTYGLSINEVTIADRLRTLGYSTGLIGKWHMGLQSQFHPQQRGFDEFFGFLPAMHSYTVWNQPNNPIYRGTQSVSESTYLTDAFSREAVDFIQRNKSRPFYLQLAFNAAHEPMQATTDYLSRFSGITDINRRTFAAMVAAMDDGVGKVITKLREMKLEDNTLIVFFSDNGGIPSGNTSRNTPLNGQKDQLLEGGIRTPAMMQWKGYLPSGVVSSAPVIALDYLPTIISAATGRRFSDQTLDGVNLIPYLKGIETDVPHDKLFWRSGTTQYAARVGDWKLLYMQNTIRLYNLASDQGESINLADSNPAKLAEMRAIYDLWNSRLPAPPR
jgi:uncharacterized protein (TIGR03437 family)